MTAKEVWEKMRIGCPACKQLDICAHGGGSAPCAFDTCPLLKGDHDS